MTVVCSTKDAKTRVTSIFIRHGQGYSKTGPFLQDPNVYLTITISLPAEKLAPIRSEVYAKASIAPGQVGADQPRSPFEFDSPPASDR